MPTLCVQSVWAQAEATSHEYVAQLIAGHDAQILRVLLTCARAEL